MPKVNSQILLWARENARFSLEEAAKKLQIKPNSLQAYEVSEKDPSRSLLKRMANLYRVSLLTFYLTDPPLVANRGEDFRTLPDDLHEQNDFLVSTLIRDIKSSQSMLKQMLIDEDEATAVHFVGSLSIDNGIDAVVQKIADSIKFDISKFRSFPDANRAFKYLRELVENSGVYVLLRGNLGSHHSNIEVSAFRGFALADEIAPFIVLNNKDAKSAWSFTVLHELAHLVLGKTGVSGTDHHHYVEEFCNKVASAVLIRDQDIELLEFFDNDFDSIVYEISVYAEKWNVSYSQLAYKLYLKGDLHLELWKRLSEHFRELWLSQRAREKAKNRDSDIRISPYVLRKYGLGNALVKTVERFTRSGALSSTKAGILLNTKSLKVHKLFDNGYTAEGDQF